MVVESLLFCTVDRLLAKFGSFVNRELSLAWGFHSDLKELERTMSAVKAVLLDAEEKQTHNRELSLWLDQLRDVFDDAEDAFDEFECEALRRKVMNRGSTSNKVRLLFSSSNPVAIRFKIAHKIEGIRKRLDKIAERKYKFHLIEREEGSFVKRKMQMTHSFVSASEVFGRGRDKEVIVDLLLHQDNNERLSIIPIVGIGGLGKTTLAKLVYNDQRSTRHFDLRMWVCVSDEFDVQRLTKEILSSATGKVRDDLTMDQLQIKLRHNLDGKKFFLVLDDVWNENPIKWRELKQFLMVGANGSKIMVTTRNQSVAKIMGTGPIHTIRGLSEEDSWSLFVKCVFKDEKDWSLNSARIGKQILKKCRGVPLAITSLGSLLYLKSTIREWEYIRDSEIWQLEENDDGVLPALRLSYDLMPSYLKPCFSYFAVFPKDHLFDSDDLIRLWMAQGILHSDNDNLELEDIGDQYFKELWSRFFFQDVKENFSGYSFKMHDLIHDLALSVAKSECFMITCNTKSIPEKVQHLSTLSSNPYVLAPLYKSNRVRSFIFPIANIAPPSESIVRVCISKFLNLRPLDLRFSSFDSLPCSINKLKHLRYLNLHGNYNIKELPNSICELQNLQTLILTYCLQLLRLPKDMGQLISLRYLWITTNQRNWLKDGGECLTSLTFLGISTCVNLKNLFEEMQYLSSLRTLIVHCKNLTSLPHGMRYLTSLETLVIKFCEKLHWVEERKEEVDLVIKLRLRKLIIWEVPELGLLPQWLQGSADSLQILEIGYCPHLIALPEWVSSLRTLQRLVIWGCPKLSSLPPGIDRLSSLREVRMSRILKQKMSEDLQKLSHAQICFD